MFDAFNQAWVLNKIQTHRGTLVALIQKAVDMVHRDQFHQSLSTLALVEQPQLQGASQHGGAGGEPAKINTKYAQVSKI